MTMMNTDDTSTLNSPDYQEIEFLNLATSTQPYAGRLKEAAARVIDSGRFLAGEETRRLEESLSRLTGASSVICVSNGLDAIRLIFRAYMEMGRLAPGDEVIVPANTFIASVLPLSELGLTPVLAPAGEDFNLDLNRIDSFITTRTRAVLLVHLYGTPCWDTAICRRLAEKGNLLIEDNAQAIGAEASSPGLAGSRMTGALGHASAISFYPTKNLGALGDAGAVMTSDPQLARTVRALANYGADRRYHNIFCGYNNRIDEIQAAFLNVKLENLEAENNARRAAAAAYDEVICNPLVATPTIYTDRRQVWHQYVVRSPRRDRLQQFLISRGVHTDIHYAVPPHLQPCYEGQFSDPSLKATAELADTLLSLPIANISPDQAIYISSIINDFKD